MVEVRQLRACCKAGTFGGTSGLVVMDAPGTEATWTGEATGEVTFTSTRDRGTAHHEAAHAVIAFAAGGTLGSVTIDGQPCASAAGGTLEARARLAVFLAGDVGQRWQQRVIFRPHDAEILEYLTGLRDLRFGKCDYCLAILAIVSLVGAQSADEHIIRVYRQVEGEVIEIIKRHDVWSAIADLADALMEDGAISGDRAHQIIGNHLVHGSIPFGG